MDFVRDDRGPLEDGQGEINAMQKETTIMLRRRRVARMLSLIIRLLAEAWYGKVSWPDDAKLVSYVM